MNNIKRVLPTYNQQQTQPETYVTLPSNNPNARPLFSATINVTSDDLYGELGIIYDQLTRAQRELFQEAFGKAAYNAARALLEFLDINYANLCHQHDTPTKGQHNDR